MQGDVTRIINDSDSKPEEAASVLSVIYEELRQLAIGKMARERPWQTLSATALVHEAWLRLEKSPPPEWRNRKHFYGAAAEAMRRILVEAARRRLAAKRGEGEGAVPLEGLELPGPIADERLLGIHEVLDRLEEEHEMDARIVKLRFFGGLKQDEIAALLEVSEKTVQRHWANAKVWLYRALSEE